MQEPHESCYSHNHLFPMVPCHPSVMGDKKCVRVTNSSNLVNVNAHPTYCQPITHMDFDNVDFSNIKTGGPILQEREHHYRSKLQLSTDDGDSRFDKLVETTYRSRHELENMLLWRTVAPCNAMDDQEDACNSALMESSHEGAQRCQFDQLSGTCEPSLLSIQTRVDELRKEVYTQKLEIQKNISQLNRIYMARYENIPTFSESPVDHIAKLLETAQRDVLFQGCAILSQYKSSMECVPATDSAGQEAHIPFFCENLSGNQASCESDMRCTYMNTLCIPKSSANTNSLNDRDVRKMICTTIPGRVWNDLTGTCWEVKNLSSRLTNTIQETLKAGGDNIPTQSAMGHVFGGGGGGGGGDSAGTNAKYHEFVEKLGFLFNSRVANRALRDIIREHVR